MVADLAKRFKAQPVNFETEKLIEDINDHFYSLADKIDLCCEESREKSLALTKLEECSFWTIACLVRNSEKGAI